MSDGSGLMRGDRVVLAETRDRHLQPGITGTVLLIDGQATVHVLWDPYLHTDGDGRQGVVKGLRRGCVAADGDVLVRLSVLT